MKTYKIVNWISTGLLTALMLFSAGMYFFNTVEVIEAFANLGFPTYIIYPLATAKILGLIAIWSKLSKSLIEWAYAGFFFNTLLAISAHLSVSDGEFPGALMGFVFVIVSYFSYKKLKAAN